MCGVERPQKPAAVAAASPARHRQGTEQNTESMGREKAARKAHTQSFTGPGARQALGQSIKSKLHLSADEQKLADKGHILDEKGDAWWRRIGYADSREEFLRFWTALRPEFREGPVPPPDGTTCKRCKMHVNLSRKPVTRNNVHRSRKNCDGGCWGQRASRSSGCGARRTS